MTQSLKSSNTLLRRRNKRVNSFLARVTWMKDPTSTGMSRILAPDSMLSAVSRVGNYPVDKNKG
jgi:hypothetical protein